MRVNIWTYYIYLTAYHLFHSYAVESDGTILNNFFPKKDRINRSRLVLTIFFLCPLDDLLLKIVLAHKKRQLFICPSYTLKSRKEFPKERRLVVDCKYSHYNHFLPFSGRSKISRLSGNYLVFATFITKVIIVLPYESNGCRKIK